LSVTWDNAVYEQVKREYNQTKQEYQRLQEEFEPQEKALQALTEEDNKARLTKLRDEFLTKLKAFPTPVNSEEALRVVND